MNALTIHQRTNKALQVTDAMAVGRRTNLDHTKPCNLWAGHRMDEGYGTIRMQGKVHYVHRVAYQLHVGPINRGQEIDHVCHTANRDTCPGGPECPHRACIEPAHLELVSSRENSMRGNHPLFAVARSNVCLRGHDLTNPANVYFHPSGKRSCHACTILNQKERRANESPEQREARRIRTKERNQRFRSLSKGAS